MNYTMKLTADPFERIRSGRKTIEVRLYDEKRKEISLGDTISFLKLPDLSETVETKVVGLSRFKSFRDLYSVFGTEPFGHQPDMTVEEQVLGMRDAYSEEQEKKFGVLGLHLQLLS